MAQLTRRQMLAGAGAAGVLVAFGGDKALARDLPREVRWRSNPFTLGVASGDPVPDGVVLWTRLAPEPLQAGGGLAGRGNLSVAYELARDEGMRRVVRQGKAVAAADLAHSVHVDVRGIDPGREYWYRFVAGDWATAPARTRTAPAPQARVGELRFAYATCQKWEEGFYNAYAHMADEELDLVVFLGDYTYEYGIDPATGGVRGVELPTAYADETLTLEQFRQRHALYKTDADLQRAHARFPFVVTWDDHEVDNDYTGDMPEDGTPPAIFRERRIAGYQAFYEHLPLRAPALPDRKGRSRLYRSIPWGSLAEFLVLDTRQYRTDHPQGDGEHPYGAGSFDPAQTVLGREQERWVRSRFRSGRARWNVLANQVLMSGLAHDPSPNPPHWQDCWDGYPVARQRLLDDMLATRLSNPFVITGDWHSTFVNDVREDFNDQASPTVATEIVAPAITSNGDGPVYGPYYGPMIEWNPHIRFFDGDRKGYVRCSATRGRLLADLRYVERVGVHGAPIETFASFVVEDGRPGAVRI
jgi:alkaline phosphatase D